METKAIESTKQVSKSKVKAGTDSLRVRRETKKRILVELSNLNKKELGSPVTADQYVSMAIALIQADHLKQLQEQSLTAKDRFEQRYKEYCSQNGKISRDEFLATLLK